MTIYSTKAQLEQIANYLTAYMRIPYFQEDTIPGRVMEKIISLVHGAKQLATYDYVDVCIEGSVGWQVKSTKMETPLTWKRAKISNSIELIKKSEKSKAGCKRLGDEIIDFCNEHAMRSLELYNLQEIGYSRLIMFEDGTACYFERLVCSTKSPHIFNKDEYVWAWSAPKKTQKKEQLPAFHGKNTKTGKKDFAWHGRGENQLHFSGEKQWWPQLKTPSVAGRIEYSQDGHAMAFKLPSDKVSWDGLTEFLNASN